MKKCNKCNVEKSPSEFYKRKSSKDGFDYKCKECRKESGKKWREVNRDKSNAISKKSYKKNKDKIKEREWYKNYTQNKQIREEWKKNNLEYYEEYTKQWKKNNPEYYKEYTKQRRLTDIEFRLKDNLKTRINKAIHQFNFKKKNTSIEELGCSIQDYFVYLGEQFDENMNWDNYGTYWEIDHIYPLSKGGSFHYTNTQPLIIEENRRKSDKI